jgi:hypothetical protein
MMSTRRAISARLRNQKYAQGSPIADARIETMYRMGRTTFVQRATGGRSASVRKIIALAIAM